MLFLFRHVLLFLAAVILCVPVFGFEPGQKDLIKQIDSLNQVSFDIRSSNRKIALALANEAARLSSDFYPEGLSRARLNLGIHYTNLSQYDSAFYCLRMAEPAFEDQAFEMGLIKYYLGVNFSSLRDLEKAASLFDIAIQFFGQAGSAEYKAYVYNSLGIVEGRQGNLEEALGFFLKSYEIKLRQGFKYDEELANIAIVYRMLRRYDDAVDFARKSRATCQELDDTLGFVQTTIILGTIFSESDLLDSAIFYFDQAFDLAVSQGYQRLMASALAGQAEVYHHSGYFGEAIQKLRRAVKLTSQKEDIWEYAYHELARVYDKTGKPDSAIYYGKRSFDLSSVSDNIALSRDNAKLLSRNYQSVNQLDSAYAYLNRFIAFKDTLISRNNESRLSDMRVRIETLEQENEIDKLHQEKELGDLKRIWLIAGIIWLVMVGFLVFMVIIYQHRDRVRKHDLEQLKLKEQVDKAQTDLYQQTLQMIHTNNCLNDIETQLVNARHKQSNGESREILRTIRLNKSLDKDWENFNQYFGSAHAEFYEKLKEACPDLSNHEQRVCALIKMNLANREIATILNIEAKSVVMLKYRIKKKCVEIGKEEDLADYLRRL